MSVLPTSFVRPGPRSPLVERVRVPWQRLHIRQAVAGRVQLGDRFRLGRGSTVWSAHGLRIGNDVAVGRYCTIEVDGDIGDFTLISAHVGIVGRGDHDLTQVGVPVRYSRWIGDRPPTPKDRVHIGRDVWIGWGAIILSGTAIGDGAVVAAGAVVHADVEPFTIVGGDPARVIGSRFTPAERPEHLDHL